MSQQPRTPLRRVSQGSLSSLARSHSHAGGSAATGLEFLAPALFELADGTETLLANVDGLDRLSDSLHTFNESFGAYLYGMKMNSLTVDFGEAPRDETFVYRRQQMLTSLERAQASLKSTTESLADEPSRRFEASFVAAPEPPSSVISDAEPTPSIPSKTRSSAPPLRKPAQTKTVLSAKEKKARDAWLEKIINLMPVNFRGGDYSLRRDAEKILACLLESSNPISRPEISAKLQSTVNIAIINKCLIAAEPKIVTKTTVKGVSMYALSDTARKL